MSRTEDLLTDALHDRVDRHDLPSTPMGDVLATAGRIRRARRVRAAAATAAVVAVLAVPVVVVGTRDGDGRPDPADPTPTTPARLLDLPKGEPPGIAWLDGNTYVDENGSRTTLPLAGVTAAVPYLGGFLVSTFDENELTLLDGRLDEVWRRCGVPGYAVDATEQYLAYVTTDCDGTDGVVHVARADGSRPEETRPLPHSPAVPIGMFGNVAVVASPYDDLPPDQIAFDDSTWDLSALKWAAGVNEQLGLVSGILDDGRQTGAVVDPRTGEVEWMLSGWSLGSFSPDGSTVLGMQTASDATRWGVFDAGSGEQLHELELPSGFLVYRAAWEGDDHVLFDVAQGTAAEALVRASLDGGLERATEVAAYDPDGPGTYRFADRIN